MPPPMLAPPMQGAPAVYFGPQDAAQRQLLAALGLYWHSDARGHLVELAGPLLSEAACQRLRGQPVQALCEVSLSASGLSALDAALVQRRPFQGVELVRVRADQSLQWLALSGQPLWDAQGGFAGYCGVAQDISQQKGSAQSLSDQQSLLRELSRRVPGLLFQLRKSPSGWFSMPFASAGLHHLFELTPEEVREDAGPVFARILPVDYVQCRASLELSEDNLTPWIQSYRVQLPDGRVLWHAANAVPQRHSDGSVVWYGYTHDISERVQAEERLRRAHAHLRARTDLMETTLQSLSQGVMMISAEGRVTYYNHRLLDILQLPEALLARQPLHAEVVNWQREHGHFVGQPEGHWAEYRPLEQAMNAPGDYLRPTHDGRVLEVRTRRLDGGGWTRTFADVTEHVRAHQARQRSELHLRTLFDAIPDRVWLKDTQGRYLMCNEATARGFGTTVAQIQGRHPRELLGDAALVAQFEQTDARALRSQAPVVYEQQLPRAGDPADCATFEVVKRAVWDSSGQALGVLGLARDVTERKRAEAQIERLAFYDPLTGLCNRRLFHDRLEHAQATCQRSQQWAAVCFIDLDHFKDLNDTQGHDQGDALLRQVAQRLQTAVREQDTVARLGGDEFVVLLEGLGAEEAQAAIVANQIGEKLLDALNRPYQLARGEHHHTPSVGITLFKDAHERVEDILKRADVAMYQSKSAGRNTLRFFDPAMQAAVQLRSELARELREALARGELVLYSQPVVSRDARVRGHEVLLRWLHPRRGVVSPAEFIPVAEQTGLIVAIGEWVLAEACRCLAVWSADPERAQWTLAVNLSARQLRLPDFVARVRRIVRDSGAPAQRLKLELTESLLLHDVEDTIVKMSALAEDGIGFALDDFGTGYSSLAYLKRLPLSTLKIDKSFVRDLLTDPNDAIIAQTILQLADSLGLDVVAEGVENEGQRDMLQAMGCQAFQGFLYSRPAPLPALCGAPASASSPRPPSDP